MEREPQRPIPRGLYDGVKQDFPQLEHLLLADYRQAPAWPLIGRAELYDEPVYVVLRHAYRRKFQPFGSWTLPQALADSFVVGRDYRFLRGRPAPPWKGGLSTETFLIEITSPSNPGLVLLEEIGQAWVSLGPENAHIDIAFMYSNEPWAMSKWLKELAPVMPLVLSDLKVRKIYVQVDEWEDGNHHKRFWRKLGFRPDQIAEDYWSKVLK
jgi:hypothetical protein